MAKVSDFSVRAVNGQFGAEMAKKFIDNKLFSAMSVISALAWGLGYFGMPHIIIRFMGIRSNAEIKTARRVGTVWMVIAYIGTFIIGSLGTVYLAGGDLANPLMILSGGKEETVFSATMQQMYPAFIAGLFLCAILAASMSTADSQLLSASSAVSLDIYKGLINKDADEKTVMNVSRITVLVIAAIAFVLSLNPASSIFGLVSYAWAGFGSTFGPLVILALFWRGMTNKGAIAGLIAGGVTVVLWHNLKDGIFNVYEILPGFIACLVFAVAVSLLDRNKNPEMLAEFDAYKKMED